MPAYYCFFPDNYTLATVHLGWLEDLAYRRLLDLYYHRGKPLPNDRAYLLRAVRANEPEQQAAVDTVLAEFFQLRTDGWHNHRADEELAYMKDRSDKARRAVLLRWEREHQKNNELTDTDALRTNAPSITPTPTPTPTSKEKTPCSPDGEPNGRFQKFWKAYPKKVGKQACLSWWCRKKPSEELLEQMLGAIYDQCQSERWTKDGGAYVPDPRTWLNQGRWEDDPEALGGPR